MLSGNIQEQIPARIPAPVTMRCGMGNPCFPRLEGIGDDPILETLVSLSESTLPFATMTSLASCALLNKHATSLSFLLSSTPLLA